MLFCADVVETICRYAPKYQLATNGLKKANPDKIVWYYECQSPFAAPKLMKDHPDKINYAHLRFNPPIFEATTNKSLREVIFNLKQNN